MSFSSHTLILKNDSTLWGCGINGSCELGLGDNNNRTTFTKIISDVKSVYCGSSHTLILKNDGTLWGCGYNEYGQLGLGDTSNRKVFAQITTNTDNIKSIYCGAHHTFILKNDGTLYGCGANGSGQLGLGDTDNRTTFTIIGINTNDIKSICCGGSHTIILKNDDTLWGTGYNGDGELGLGDTTNRYTFTQIITNADNMKSIYCSYYHTLILKNNGTLWGCGRNDHGRLGLGDDTYRYSFTQITTNADNIKSVYCGAARTLILKNDGTLWGAGYNGEGQLGLGDTYDRYTFTQITNDVKLVYCGWYHTIILKNDDTLYTCGHNSYGQLGLGDTSNRYTFTQITTNANNIKCFANNYSNLPSIIKIYDTKIGYVKTLDTNNFRNIPTDSIKTLKVLYSKPENTLLSCIISFDEGQTWKTFDGTNWITISDISPENIILNGMEVSGLNSLDNKKLISGGFTGDLDFKIAMKTNDTSKTPSITKIYIEYK